MIEDCLPIQTINAEKNARTLSHKEQAAGMDRVMITDQNNRALASLRREI
ncbi:MAG: hypothetical protein HY232_05825 [Acidobacteria bacterium]|nr:hypothetical protein [Acidobacteriota bacterium]